MQTVARYTQERYLLLLIKKTTIKSNACEHAFLSGILLLTFIKVSSRSFCRYLERNVVFEIAHSFVVTSRKENMVRL